MIPTLFGFPLWYGKIRARTAKKHIHRETINHFLNPSRYKFFRDMKVGDIVNDCSGMNRRIVSVFPEYYSPYSRQWPRHHISGMILFDVDLRTTHSGCSLISCGIERPKSREVIERDYVKYTEEWLANEEEMIYYRSSDHLQKKIIRAQKRIAAVKAGGHFTDEDGLVLEEFDETP